MDDSNKKFQTSSSDGRAQERKEWERIRKLEVDNAELRAQLAARESDFRTQDALLEKIAELQQRIAELEELSRKALNALVWCGGSNDFAPEGKARLGWENVVVPVMQDAHTILVGLPTSKSEGAGGGVYTMSASINGKDRKDTETR